MKTNLGLFVLHYRTTKKELLSAAGTGQLRFFLHFLGIKNPKARGIKSWVASIHFTRDQHGLITATSSDKDGTSLG